MCMTLEQAELSSTLIYVGEAIIKDNKYVHILAYQNTAKNKSDNPNAMVIPFPTTEYMDEENVIDTRACKNFLQNITHATEQKSLSRGLYLYDSDDIIGCAGSVAQVFDVGSYTVILANKVTQIPEALKRVPKNKRPVISVKFLIEFNKLYPNQPIAICCWEGYIEAEPLLWWYIPNNKDKFFIPTMDAHDGNGPKKDSSVWVDHIINVGSTIAFHSDFPISYENELSDQLKELLPNFAYGVKITGKYKNGDMFINVNELNAPGIFRDLIYWNMQDGWC